MCASPEEIARQLVLIDSELFLKINVTELLNLSCTYQLHFCIFFSVHKMPRVFFLMFFLAGDSPKLKYLAPNVITLIKRTDKISSWVASTIVSAGNSRKRASRITLFIHIAKVRFFLTEFSGIFAVFSYFFSTFVT
jgi:hypothetical protein